MSTYSPGASSATVTGLRSTPSAAIRSLKSAARRPSETSCGRISPIGRKRSVGQGVASPSLMPPSRSLLPAVLPPAPASHSLRQRPEYRLYSAGPAARTDECPQGLVRHGPVRQLHVCHRSGILRLLKWGGLMTVAVGERERRLIIRDLLPASHACRRRWEVTLVAVIVAVALCLRLYDVAALPAGFHGDEAGIGLEGQRLP